MVFDRFSGSKIVIDRSGMEQQIRQAIQFNLTGYLLK